MLHQTTDVAMRLRRSIPAGPPTTPWARLAKDALDELELCYAEIARLEAIIAAAK